MRQSQTTYPSVAHMPVNIATTFVDLPAMSHPARLAIAGESGSLTYGELLDLTNRAGNVLRALGCAAGDRVLLALPDSAELAAFFFGCAKVAAIAVPVSPYARADDHAHFAADTAARIVVADPCAVDDLNKAVRLTGVTTMVVRDGRAYRHGQAGPEDLLSQVSAHLETSYVDDTTPAALLYTSGSTGRQKAAIHSHASFLHAAVNVGQRVFGIRPDDRVLSVPKLSFAFGLGFGLCFPLAAGASTFLNPKAVDLETVARLIVTWRPTILAAVPSVLASLLRSRRLDAEALRAVRYVASAGEPLPASVFEGFRTNLGVEAVDGIGSTEMLTHFISHQPGAARPGTCGAEVPGCRTRLVGDDGQCVTDGEVGTLWLQGETLFRGYWNRPDQTARVLVDGWFNTGDQLRRDATGHYRYVGRADDMVKASGIWVSGRDVESALREHPFVDQAAVTAREDPTGIRRLVAYVVPTRGEDASAIDLLKHLGARLPAHMLPAAFVTVDALPLTPNGKLSRGDLPEPSWPSSRAGARRPV